MPTQFTNYQKNQLDALLSRPFDFHYNKLYHINLYDSNLMNCIYTLEALAKQGVRINLTNGISIRNTNSFEVIKLKFNGDINCNFYKPIGIGTTDRTVMYNGDGTAYWQVGGSAGPVADIQGFISSNQVVKFNATGWYAYTVQIANNSGQLVGTGINLTNLNASNIASGTIASARLPSPIQNSNIDVWTNNKVFKPRFLNDSLANIKTTMVNDEMVMAFETDAANYHLYYRQGANTFDLVFAGPV